MDVERALRRAIETGEVVLGARQSLQAIQEKKARLVLVAQNAPPQVQEAARQAPRARFPGTNHDLGIACGKPFSVSILAILDPGESEILSLPTEDA
ncbi:MAG: 50S ribosomal protein L30e [Euryarchaeota archaeon]|nr:50S ribosomal protein L30e [Euryarchaeota archaeon]